MSTNYYLVNGACPCCGCTPEPLHLGVSVPGYCFNLHVYPDRGLSDLPEIVEHLYGVLGEKREPRAEYPRIEDEYGRPVSLCQFTEVVTERSRTEVIKEGWEVFFQKKSRFVESEERFHAINHTERGPSGLLRSKVDGVYCIGHGAGTWDLWVGDFC